MQTNFIFQAKWRRIAVFGFLGLAFAFAATAAKAQSASALTEPTTEGVFYLVDANGTQRPLENTTEKLEGNDSSTPVITVQGEHSSVRFPSDTNFKFLVRLPQGFSPHFTQFDTTLGVRKIVFQRKNGKTQMTSGALVRFDSERVGSSSVLVTPKTPLLPGEYCLSPRGGRIDDYCFGVDASNGSAGSPQAQSQTPISGSHAMTNDDVVKLVSAGLSPDVISSAIRQASDHAFDLSIDGLIALKQKKVPDSVLATMQSSNSSATAIPTPTTPTSLPTQARTSSPAWNLPLSVPVVEDAFYYVNSDGKLAPLRAESYSIVGNGTEETSRARRVHLRMFGAKSPLRFSSGDVTIAFRLCKKSIANDFAANSCTVSDVVFERWESVQGAREAEIAPNRLMAKRFPDPGQFDIVTKEVGERAYSMKPAEPLMPGEYCISYNASALKLYCFGVDAPR